jgi:hypothetical protein
MAPLVPDLRSLVVRGRSVEREVEGIRPARGRVIDTELEIDEGTSLGFMSDDAATPRGRATTWDGFMERLDLMFQSEEVAYRDFEPRSSDVIISPFAKCGTTWLQQIVHSLRTGGDMDFKDIYEVVPFIDVAPDMGIDLDGPQKAEPRVFKSHLGWDEVPKGCRYIVSFRDPQDAVVSFYYFMTGWLIEPGAIPLDDFVAYRTLDGDSGGGYWAHMASWLRQRENADVLLLTFEDIKDDLRSAVERIASFIGIDDKASIDTAVAHSTFDFMSSHSEPFSEPWQRRHMARLLGIPVDSDATKVRRGTVGENRRELSTETRARLDQIWDQTIAVEFGYARYRDLDEALRR